jgi:curli biogenesis system outer membrane secretion channel CsgG
MKMQKSLITLLVVIASMSLTACAKDETTPVTTTAKPTAAETKPQPPLKTPTSPAVKIPVTESVAPVPTSKPVVDPAALLILGRLEKAGEKYTTLQSDVVMNIRSPLTGDVTQRTGSVAYQKG